MRQLAIVCCTLTISLVAWTSEGRAQSDYRVLGSTEAPVEMLVFSDFECPYCRNFALAAMPAIIAEFVDRGLVRVRFVHFPLAGIHRNAVPAAKAAHCAGLAGRFWAYHDYLFVRQPEWIGQPVSDSLWASYAASLGLEPSDFALCYSAPETLAAVEADLRQALKAGATGTPTIVIGGRSITGIESYETLRRQILDAIDEARTPR